MGSFRLLIIFIGSLFLSSCGYYFNAKPTSIASGLQEQEKRSVDFSTVKEMILSARCTSCHQQYENYESVVRELAAIQAAVNSDRMPKTGGPLTGLQKEILAAWIANGAPNQAQAPPDPPLPTPLAPNWKSISENILFPKCLACHNPQGQAKFLDLSTRQIIFDNRNRVFGSGAKLIDIDSPENSYLLEILKDEEEPMPPVWSNIPRLNPDEIKVLTEWLRLGLP